jgi:hypothetical protein
MHWKYDRISSVATITAACPRCNAVFYIDTDYPQQWLAQYAPGLKPGETVRYPCRDHLGCFELGPATDLLLDERQNHRPCSERDLRPEIGGKGRLVPHTAEVALPTCSGHVQS